MKKLVRFGVSLDQKLLQTFDRHIEQPALYQSVRSFARSHSGQSGRRGMGRE